MPSKRIHLQVGIFSTLALVLLVAGIGLLASDAFFRNKDKYLLYFEGSVAGLNVGAPVVFRGVLIGRVTSISLVANNKGEVITIPVGIDIFEENIRHFEIPGGVTEAARDEMIQSLKARGLRARIATVSFLTGQARIELDLLPESPVRYHSADSRGEIATLSSPMEEFSRALSKISIDKIADKLLEALENINDLMHSTELRDTLIGFKELADGLSVVSQEIPALLLSVRNTLHGIEKASGITARELPGLSQDMHVALENFGKAAESADKLFLNAGRLTSPNAATVRDLQSAVKELAEAARAVRSLATTLERHPESLLRGRGRAQP